MTGVRESDQLIEPRRCLAGIDRSTGDLEALSDIVCEPGSDERRSGIEQHGVATATLLAGEDGADPLGVEGRIATGELCRGARIDSERARIQLPLVQIAVANLDDEVGTGGESSSIPPSPCTTSACRAPRSASASA